MKGTIPVVFVVILLAVGGTVALSSTYMRPAVVSPSSLAGPTSTGETNPQTALKFAMAINSSSVGRGGVLGVSLSLFNTLIRDNNVTGDQNWKLTDASESGGVYGWNCAQNDVFRMEVVSGHYDISNFSVATPLDAFVWTLPLGPNQCGYYIRPANWTATILTVPPNNQNYYVFRPTSDAALWVTASDLASRYAPCVPSNGTYHCMRTTGQAAVMSETMILKTGLFASSSGIFTVVGGDEWGDLAVLHFYVGSGTSQETSSTETCTPAITLTQTGANATTTQVITLCHTRSTYSVSNTASVTPLQIETDINPVAGQPTYLHAVFTNTGNAPVDLSDYTFKLSVIDSLGNISYSTFCEVTAPNPILTTDHTWDCGAYWTAGPAGLYHMDVSIYSISQKQNVATANTTIITH